MILWTTSICIVYATAAVSPSPAAKSYEGAQLLSIPDPALKFIRRHLISGDAQIWAGDKEYKDVLVLQKIVGQVHEILKAKGVEYKVTSENIQAAINEESKKSIVFGIRKSNSAWNSYLRLNDIYRFMHELARKHENVRVITMGRSYLNRKILVAHISSGIKGAKRIWIDGGIHAREWISISVALYIMNELATKSSNLVTSKPGIDFYIAPVLNPDGYEYSHVKDRMWRKNMRKVGNCPGVDLNRNWDANWKPSSVKYCDSQTPGEYEFSEIETRCISRFILRHKKNMMGYFSLHSYSQLLLYPEVVGDETIKTENMLRDIGSKMASAASRVNGTNYTVKNIQDMVEGIGGSSVDWALKIGIKFPFAMELRPEKAVRTGFILPPSEIIPTGKEALAAVKVLASTIRALDKVESRRSKRAPRALKSSF